MTVSGAHRRVPGARALLLGFVCALGCTLRSDVSISPLVLKPNDTIRTSNRVEELVDVGDYPRALLLAPAIDRKANPSVAELTALGKAELYSGRLEDAKRHLRAAIGKKPFRDTYADIAWCMSQAEWLDRDYAAALYWAEAAADNGLEIRSWHMDLLGALQSERTFVVTGKTDTTIPIVHKRPSIPRVDTHVNGKSVTGIIDSGAVMTIVSDRLAAEAKLRMLGDFTGTFFGLLGEPIEVRFAMLETIRLGDIEVKSVPVAVMAGEKMKFFTLKRTPFHIDLLLGANLLREFRIELDFDADKATLHYLAASERIPAIDQNLFILNSKPYVHGSLNGQGWLLYQLDTGSEITYLNSVEISRWKLQSGLSTIYQGAELQGLGGSTKRGMMVNDVGVGIGDWEGTFKTLPLYSSEKTGAVGLVGENFLKNFKLTLDFGSMQLLLERPGSAK